ncbi:Ca-activated chloride channel family protein [Catalinimonas alkaloidigena]|uniref:vWA domain-containing protein n=1 Tax=Catalinimonas alkaloidigena TaxID=1075417 RepID=UPI0024058ACC|nr:von Willebrand factor type A domain-containing protein [Catalinimonas alkaloidigena]MDF9796770.1 Ca-activated chloride channel family protein [Catalinimonas alkaloidigena]
MKKYIFIFIALVLMAFTHRLSTAYTVTGIVTSAEDGSPLPGVNVLIKGTDSGTITDLEGKFQLEVTTGQETLIFSSIGFATEEVNIKQRKKVNVSLKADVQSLSEVVVTTYGRQQQAKMSQNVRMEEADYAHSFHAPQEEPIPQHNTENYATIHENDFLEVKHNALSTFSIDVDAASYSNIRRFIDQGQMPPKDAVRIEEMVNYFTYDYAQPKGNTPFAIATELSACPWNEEHQLVHIGLQGKQIPTEDLPPSNLVFLIDVSGSMNAPSKLPLLKSAFRMLVKQMRPEDRVAIVVYAGAAGMVLPSTPASQKEKIMLALDQLQAGGSTAGGAGIKLAYTIAKENFQEDGNNRVILATDGDFNVGESSDAGMERLIEQKREDGVFLTVLGFGMGNYKDSKMEILADKGNGNYAYIDNIQEAKKVLVNEFGGTLFTIAKDVKLQLEFNPTKVKAYRLLGYENRALKNEDFNNDKKDAGELGSGHTVTAMYEIIPADSEEDVPSVEPLKYQEQKVKSNARQSDEMLILKLRYKSPDGSKSQLIEQPLLDRTVRLEDTSDNFRFAAAVAGFGMLLRDSEYKGDLTYDAIARLAQGAKGGDKEGYRQEFIRMVESCNLMASK